MGIETISILLLAGFLLFLAAGVPMAFACGMLGVTLACAEFGLPDLGLLMQRIYALCTEYVLISVPMFILMASLMERSGLAKDKYDALDAWLGRVRGGVGVVALVMAIVLAAMSGIIGGEIVLLGLVALSRMLRLGYNKRIAMGSVCAGGSLGTMIPPSIVLIVYGLITDTPISSLFTAAILPGLLLGGIYIAYILVRVRVNPALAPLVEDAGPPLSFAAKLAASKGLLGPILLVVVVLGSIYGGITFITEAATMGVVGVLALIVLRGEFRFALLREAFDQTLRSVGILLWVTFGASTLIGAYTLAGGPRLIGSLITGLEIASILIVLLMMLVFLFLGAFMDWIGISLLCMPIFVPIIKQLGYDPIWFGILFCINMQVSFLSPPFGPAAFYLESVGPPGTELVEIFKSFGPLVAMQILVLALVLAFPGLALWLVR